MRALVIAGGGMRGAFCSGATLAMQEMGLRFDAVYGTSAGGAMAAWFGAGQADDGTRTWKYAADRTVMSYRRYLSRRGPLVDLDRLYDHVYPHEVGLEIERFPKLPCPVRVTASDIETGRCVYLDLREHDVLASLKATSALPFITGGPVLIDHRSYLDGGLTDPVPIRRAIEDGADEIVVVFNRPKRDRKPEPRIATWAFQRTYPTLGEVANRHDELCNEASDLAHLPPEGLRIEVIRPDAETGVGRLTRDVERLHDVVHLGHQHAHAVLA